MVCAVLMMGIKKGRGAFLQQGAPLPTKFTFSAGRNSPPHPRWPRRRKIRLRVEWTPASIYVAGQSDHLGRTRKRTGVKTNGCKSSQCRSPSCSSGDGLLQEIKNGYVTGPESALSQRFVTQCFPAQVPNERLSSRF